MLPVRERRIQQGKQSAHAEPHKEVWGRCPWPARTASTCRGPLALRGSWVLSHLGASHSQALLRCGCNVSPTDGDLGAFGDLRAPSGEREEAWLPGRDTGLLPRGCGIGASGIWAGRAVTGTARQCGEHAGFQTGRTMCTKTWNPRERQATLFGQKVQAYNRESRADNTVKRTTFPHLSSRCSEACQRAGRVLSNTHFYNSEIECVCSPVHPNHSPRPPITPPAD